MKKPLGILVLALALGLAACGSKPASHTSTKSAAVKTTAVKKAVKGQLNFKQIKQGNFSSLTGHWTQIAGLVNRHNGTRPGYTTGGSAKMTATAKTLRLAQVQLQGGQLRDDQGQHPLTFKAQGKSLVALLKDADKVAINWAVTFYPKGSTSKYQAITGTPTNQQNLVELWSSNNSQTWVFAENVSSAQLKQLQGLNLTALAANDFTSLIGTWKNETTGKTITVTSRVIKRPEGMNVAASAGAALTSKDPNGVTEVITSGSETDGYMIGAYGTFDPKVIMSAFDPLGIVPKGVQMTANDDSDMTRDRLILGGGQSGYKDEAYYRVK